MNNMIAWPDIFCTTLRSLIQWEKSRKPPTWSAQQGWSQIQLGNIFMFMGIPFQASLSDLQGMVIQLVEKKTDKWLAKLMSLVSMFQICVNILATNHVYYSPHWVPCTCAYQ